MAGTIRQQAGKKSVRVSGVTGDQTVLNAKGTLQRLVISNITAAGNVAIKDSGTTKFVVRIGVDTTVTVELGIFCATSIVVNPSATTIDILAFYDV